MEVPELIADLKAMFGTQKLTFETKSKIKIDFISSVICFNEKNYYISPVGKAAQELIVTGGLENWVKHNLE